MKTELFVSVDVGGTYSRLRAVVSDDEKPQRISSLFQKKISSKKELGNFIRTSLQEFCPGLVITRAVVGFAGAIIDHQEVQMTNWQDRSRLTKKDLQNWGFPAEKMLFLNDMELASYGILQMIEQRSQEFITLYSPEKQTKTHLQNKLVIAPGTGFGTATILDHGGKKQILPSEIQHIQIPIINIQHEHILKKFKDNYPEKKYFSFEDFVSGKGLEDSYYVLSVLARKEKKISAAEIAQKALAKEDEIAIQALALFYALVGRLVQAMALALQPYGGIFIAGASSLFNKNFILESELVAEIHNCKVRKKLLQKFPIFLVTKPALNVSGGLWACEKNKL